MTKFGLRGFLIETILNNIRRLVQSLIHGLLLHQHSVQIVSLTALDLILVFYCLSMRNYFKYKVHFISCTVYYGLFCIINMVLVVYSFGWSPEANYDEILLVFYLMLLSISFLRTLIILVESGA